MPNYVVYDPDTGQILRAGEAPATMIEAQAGPDEVVVTVPAGVLAWPEINLEPLREALCAEVDQKAEAMRLLFVTPGAGQAMEYQEALAQARAFIANEAGDYPFLEADVTAGTIDPRTGLAVQTIEEAAALVIWMHGRWQMAGAAIRAVRLGAKAAIGAATNIAALVMAGAVDWDLAISEIE